MTTKRLIFALLVAVLLATAALGADATVQGRLSDNGRPISGAMVIAQRFSDQKCAELFRKQKVDEKAKQKLQACSADLSPVFTNEKGEFSISLTPGIYAIRFLWLISEKPLGRLPKLCRYRDWVVGTYPWKDSTGKYDSMAQGYPVEFGSGETKQVDFSYKDSLGAEEKCVQPQ